MRITYDPSADMGYVRLVEPTTPGSVHRSVVIEHDALQGDVVIDLDGEGRIIGFEIFQGRKQLPREVLAIAGEP
jgi:uncharacterized protein YuzE